MLSLEAISVLGVLYALLVAGLVRAAWPASRRSQRSRLRRALQPPPAKPSSLETPSDQRRSPRGRMEKRR